MNIFLLRWNPAISSWKDADFREALAKSREGPVAMDRLESGRERRGRTDFGLV